MNLKELNLIGFGKFENKKLNFEKGINLIYGENEMGKSTIHSFIDGMFYGFLRPNVKSALYTDEHKKYDPWNSNRYAGMLIFDQDEEQYRIEREFTKGKESTKVFRDGMGTEITRSIDTGDTRIQQPGLHFFGFNTSVFSNTISIKQLQTPTDDKLAKEVTEKLINVTTALDEDISVDKAILDLKSKVDEIGTERAPTKPYARNIIKINNLYKKRKEILSKKEEYESYLGEKAELLKQLVTEEEKLKKLEKDFANVKIIESQKILKEARGISDEIKRLNRNIEEIPAYENSIQDDYDKYEAIEEEKNHIIYNKLDNKLEFLRRDYSLYKEKKSKINILLVLSTISSIILLFINKFLIGITLILTGVQIFDLRKIKNRIKQIELEISLKEKQEKAKKDRVLEKSKLQNILLEKYNVNNKDEFRDVLSGNHRQLNDKANLISQIEMKKELQKRILANNTIENLERTLEGKNIFLAEDIDFDKDQDQLAYEITISRDLIYNFKIALTEGEANFNMLEKEVSKLVEIEEIIYEKEQYKNRLDYKLESLNIAIDTIEELSKDIHSQFTPGINKKVSKIIEKITGGKYNKVRVDESLNISVENPITKELIDISSLSGGSIDQLYFSLRFGIINSIDENDLPLILDDCFIQYDDSRLINIIKFLSEISRERQIILFSCHNREEEIMKDLALDYNFINLS